ncbi:hypothetical protein ACWD3J_14005 [Streptomyces sp. NPDC002755]
MYSDSELIRNFVAAWRRGDMTLADQIQHDAEALRFGRAADGAACRTIREVREQIPPGAASAASPATPNKDGYSQARVKARLRTPGGGTVTLHDGNLIDALVGLGRWFECTGCGPTRHRMTTQSGAGTQLLDYDDTELAATQHAQSCHRSPN